MAGLWDTAAFGTGSPAETAEKAPNLFDKLFSGAVNSLATLPQRAIENSQYSLDTGNYDPSVPVEAAMTMTGGAGAIPAEANSLRAGIKAYHGSPHDFDAFSLDKIGTGEGAQAYGHGLYFAENPSVAEEYKKALSQAALSKFHDDLLKYGRAERPTPPAGKMYEVNINADPEHFLDWDKPLSEQPQANKVMDAINARRGETEAELFPLNPAKMTGEQAYRMLHPESRFNSGAATDTLREAGIPGIKYLDQGSRASGDGSRNYVVFNDKIIDILRKYGVALPGGAAAADMYARQDAQ